MEVSLITGRTIDQGCGKEEGKLSDEYMSSVAICEMCEEDMKKVKIRDGHNVKVTTISGSVVVKAKKSRRTQPGTVFIPYGPWANLILPPNTDGTGMPLLKGVMATLEPTNERVLNVQELLAKFYGEEKDLR